MTKTRRVPKISDIIYFSEVNTPEEYILQAHLSGIGPVVLTTTRPEEYEDPEEVKIRLNIDPEQCSEYILDTFKVWVYDTYWSE